MQSIREIYKIGRGPSSSHTMGPEKAAKVFLEKYKNAESSFSTVPLRKPEKDTTPILR